MTTFTKGLTGLALAAAMALPGSAAMAQDYPSHEINILAAAPAGSSGDAIVRILAEAMSRRLGQPVLVENKPGADGNMAADNVVRSDPDGYTLLFNYTGHVINPSLFSSMPFDTVNDFTPISLVATNWTLLVVNADSKAQTIDDLIAEAKAEPGALSVGYLQGSATHMASELFIDETGIDVLRIPYKSNNQAMTDLLGGRISFTFSTIASIRGQLDAKAVRALGVTGKERSPLLPDVPAIAEKIPGYEATGWYGLVGPKDLPPDIVAKLNTTVNEVLTDPAVVEKLNTFGTAPTPSTAEEFTAFIASEIPRWQAVAEKAGITKQ